MKIQIINGPNLNLLGKRQPQHYGHMNFDDFLEKLRKEHKKVDIRFFQSNREGDIINAIQECDEEVDGIILNAGAYTHTSIAIADCIQAVSVPVIEVHISNVFARESFRHTSYLSPYCVGVIAGFGLTSYKLALEYLLHHQ